MRIEKVFTPHICLWCINLYCSEGLKKRRSTCTADRPSSIEPATSCHLHQAIFLSQSWVIVNWKHWNTPQWNFNLSRNMCIQENWFLKKLVGLVFSANVFVGAADIRPLFGSADCLNSLDPGRFELKFRCWTFTVICMLDSRGVPCEMAFWLKSLALSDDYSFLVQLLAWCR